MSGVDVLYRVVDRAGGVHRVKAATMTAFGDREVVFMGKDGGWCAQFIDPTSAVVASEVDSVNRSELVPGGCLSLESRPFPLGLLGLGWFMAVLMALSVAINCYEFFGSLG